jgi:hypothetical protein
LPVAGLQSIVDPGQIDHAADRQHQLRILCAPRRDRLEAVLMRGPKLKSVNVTKRSQDELHAQLCESAHRRHERIFADRDPNGDDAQRVRQRFYDDGPDLPAALERDVCSNQAVMTFRDITFGSTVPPDMRHVFHADELAEVIEADAVRPLTDPAFYRHIHRIENSQHAALVGFQSDSQERAQIEHEKKLIAKADKLRRRAERAGHKVAENLVEVDDKARKEAREKAEKYAKIRRDRAAESYDRYQHGFFFGGGKIANDIYEKFHEFFGPDILRSHLGSPSLARVAQILPPSGQVRAGYDKTFVIPAPNKLTALDAPYVEADGRFLRMMVQEFDIVATSAGAFRQMLLKVLPTHMMPQLIVGRTPRHSSRFAKMHCIWLLNPAAKIKDADGNVKVVDSCVWNEPPKQWHDPVTGEVEKRGDKRCKTGPIEKYWMVHRALKKLLLPLGCDPAFHNVHKPKNALSPFWTTIVCNDDYWATLDDFVALPGFDPKVDLADLEEQATKMRAEAAGEDVEPELSDLYWRSVGNLVVPLTMLQLKVRAPDFIEAGKKGVAALATWFEAKIRPDLKKAFPAADEALDVTINRRCVFAAKYALGKLRRPRRAVNRGRDRDLLTSDLTAEQRLEEAGRRSAAHERRVNLWNMRKGMVMALTTGELRKTEFIKSCGFARSTAYKLFEEAISGLRAEEVSSGCYRYTASPSLVRTTSLPPSILALRETVDCAGAASSPPNPAKTIDLPPWIEDDGPPEVGLRDHQRLTHARGPVDRVPEAVEA